MKTQYVKDLRLGQQVNDLFAVQSKDPLREYKSKPGFWFSFTASDKTGSIVVKFWGNDKRQTTDFYNLLNLGDVVMTSKAQVKSDNFTKKPEIHVNGMPEIRIATDFDHSDFVSTTARDIPEMISQLRTEIDAISDPDIRRLLKSMFDNDDFMKKYSTAPAAKRHHHNYVGGLLEHVISMIAMAKTIMSQYGQDIDPDLVIAGCMLHDIGKTIEYKTTTIIDYTDQGTLLGHISMGAKMAESEIDKLEGFPVELKNKLLHLILSHHGQLEYGSPVKPCFVEALILHIVDSCDSKVKYAIQERNKILDTADGETARNVGPFDILYLK